MPTRFQRWAGVDEDGLIISFSPSPSFVSCSTASQAPQCLGTATTTPATATTQHVFGFDTSDFVVSPPQARCQSVETPDLAQEGFNGWHRPVRVKSVKWANLNHRWHSHLELQPLDAVCVWQGFATREAEPCHGDLQPRWHQGDS